METIDFLKKYKLSRKEEKQNFFQIAGFPHYENVFSNVLAFFIENEPLIYRSLLECLNISSFDTVEEVVREETTDEDKRIDITVNASERIIGIENKINASLYNDTENYYQHLKATARNENKGLICIILSKNEITNIPYNFVNITHSDLANQIKKHNTELSRKMESRYFQILQEFIENIFFLQRGTMMDEKFIKLLDDEDYRKKLEDIYENCHSFRKELEKKANELKSQLNTSKIFKNKGIWKDEELGYFQICVTLEKYLFVKDCNICVVIAIFHNFYEIQIEEKEGKYDVNFYKTIKKILPGYKDNYYVNDVKSVCYKHKIREYDILLDKANEIILCFKNYKNQKRGA